MSLASLAFDWRLKEVQEVSIHKNQFSQLAPEKLVLEVFRSWEISRVQIRR